MERSEIPAPCGLRFAGRSEGKRSAVDKHAPARLIGITMIRRVAAVASLALLLGCSLPALALVGGAAPADGTGAGGHVVLIVGSRGNSCTGTAIARDLVLTAAHCVLPGADYKLVGFEAGRQPVLKDVTSVSRHPQFKVETLLAHRATADVALLKLAQPLPAGITAAALAGSHAVAAGDRFVVAGYGVTVRGDGKSGGTARTATLAATGRPGNLQIRLA